MIIKALSSFCLFAGLMLGLGACHYTKDSYPVEETDLTGSWEVVGFGRSDGINGFAGQVFGDSCRTVLFAAGKQISVTSVPGGTSCYTGTWSIVQHNGNNLRLEGQGKVVEWAVVIVTESGNQLSIHEGDIQYNLVRQ